MNVLTIGPIIPEPIYCQEYIPNNNLITMTIIILIAILFVLVLAVVMIKIFSKSQNNKY